MSVTARLEGTDFGSGMDAVIRRPSTGFTCPRASASAYGGTYQEQQKSFRDLVFVLILAVLFVFIVLLFEFRTFAAPLAILASALLSTSGVFIALLITGTTFNVSSFMGMIMVIGIVAKNGILLLDADQKFRKLGFSAEDAMLQASRRRLRPIVMTAHGDRCGHAAACLRFGCGIANAAAAGDRGDWRNPDLDGAVAGDYARGSLLPESRGNHERRVGARANLNRLR